MANIIVKSKDFHKNVDKQKDKERKKEIENRKSKNKKLASDSFLSDF